MERRFETSALAQNALTVEFGLNSASVLKPSHKIRITLAHALQPMQICSDAHETGEE